MTPADVITSISHITSELIRNGLSDAQNYPSKTKNGSQTSINYSGFKDVSIALKNVSYSEIYKHMEKERQFNIKMLDGGLLQLLYTFEKNSLIKHRLCYFPSPSFETFQNEPDIYLDESQIYADVTQRSILPVPMRFDFSPADAEPVDHPASHLTLGQYKNCRIPVNSPLCPSTFVNFVIKSFYFNAKYKMPKIFDQKQFEATLHDAEKTMVRIAIY